MATNSITGDSISTKFSSKEAQKNFEDNFDKIFGKKDVLCDICGKNIASVKECAWTSCALNWDETRIDIIGSNSNEGLHYDK